MQSIISLSVLLGLLLLLCNPENTSSLLVKNPQARDQNNNLIPGFWDDWVAFSRVDFNFTYPGWNVDPNSQSNNLNDLEMLNRNTTTISLVNDEGNEIIINSMTVADPEKFIILTKLTLPYALPTGSVLNLTLQFTSSYFVVNSSNTNGQPKDARFSTLTILSNASQNNNLTINLAGAYMAAPEGGNEIFLEDIITVFGWTTFVNELDPTVWLNWPHLSENVSTGPLGDEIFESLWTIANLSEPVYVRWIAAFSHCCDSPAFFSLEVGASDVSGYPLQSSGTTIEYFDSLDPLWTQSILPGGLNSTFADAYLEPGNQSFSINVDGYSSVGRKYVGLHFYPVRDRYGAIVNNTYFIAQDFVTPYYNGCLDPYVYAGHANCDFQDNLVYITNIKPANTNYPTPPSAAATTSGAPFGGSSGYQGTSDFVPPHSPGTGGSGTPPVDGQQSPPTTQPVTSVPATTLSTNILSSTAPATQGVSSPSPTNGQGSPPSTSSVLKISGTFLLFFMLFNLFN